MENAINCKIKMAQVGQTWAKSDRRISGRNLRSRGTSWFELDRHLNLGFRESLLKSLQSLF
ncbi:hypothetical protein HYPP_02458 [Hyphomicrobium sp. ghe19]|nr:hypothetical protein HYPP_02458 [Hyphomicrobium sp. ghe19]